MYEKENYNWNMANVSWIVNYIGYNKNRKKLFF